MYRADQRGTSPDWSAAEGHLLEAARLTPQCPLPLRSLGSLAAARQDPFDAAFFLVKAAQLEAATISSSTSSTSSSTGTGSGTAKDSGSSSSSSSGGGIREQLLDLFEAEKARGGAYQAVTALSGLSLAEHRLRFRTHFLAAVGIAYSRTDADRLGDHLDKMKRHAGANKLI